MRMVRRVQNRFVRQKVVIQAPERCICSNHDHNGRKGEGKGRQNNRGRGANPSTLTPLSYPLSPRPYNQLSLHHTDTHTHTRARASGGGPTMFINSSTLKTRFGSASWPPISASRSSRSTPSGPASSKDDANKKIRNGT